MIHDDFGEGISLGLITGLIFGFVIGIIVFFGQCSQDIEEDGRRLGKCEMKCNSEKVEIREKQCFCLKEPNEGSQE